MTEELFKENGLRCALLATGLGICAIVGNITQYPIFFGMTYIFGSIFTMLAIQSCGIWPGVLIAFVSSLYTYVSWHHPHSIITFTIEALVVGYLFRRRRQDLVIADILFWIVVGAPLVFLFFVGMMKVSGPASLTIFLKQALNHIANTLLARVAFFVLQWVVYGPLKAKVQIREALFTILSAFVLIPSLIMLTRSGHAEFRSHQDNVAQQLQKVSVQMTTALNSWTDEQFGLVDRLSRQASKSGPAALQPNLADVLTYNLNITRIGVTDSQATLRAYYPPLDDAGQPMVGRNYRDRPYLPELREKLQPMLSEVVMSRFQPSQPIVMFLHPLVNKGTFAGYVAATVNLDRLKKRLDGFSDPWGFSYLVYDKNGAVVVSNSPQYPVMSKVQERERGETIPVTAKVSHWVPELGPAVPIVEHWKRSYYHAGNDIHRNSTWRIEVRAPFAPLQSELNKLTNRNLVSASVGVLIAIIFAYLISRYMTRPLERLSLITSELSGSLNGISQVDWPETGIEQVQTLTDNFKIMGDTLKRQFNTLREEVEQRRHAQEEVSWLNEDLVRQKQALEVANKEMEAFSYSVSHDLRAPLRHINGFCRIVHDQYQDKLDDEGKSYLDRISGAAVRMGQLIDDLLQLGRVGRLDISPMRIDFTVLAEDIISDLKELEPGRSVTINVARGLEAHADFTLARLVLQNLLGNAWKYTTKTPEPVIEFGTMGRDGRQVFFVRDNGVGFSMDHREKLFGVFQRLHSEQDFPGTGVGLAIVKRIIERHGGEVGAESQPGMGALFWFTLSPP